MTVHVPPESAFTLKRKQRSRWSGIRNKTAVKPVVSAEVPKRLQTAGSPEAYRRGAKYEGQKADFGESPLMNSFQFDGVFEDGALWKHGNLG